MSGVSSAPNSAVSGDETNSYFNHDGVNNWPASGTMQYAKHGLMHGMGTQQGNSVPQLNTNAMATQPAKYPQSGAFPGAGSIPQWPAVPNGAYNMPGTIANVAGGRSQGPPFSQPNTSHTPPPTQQTSQVANGPSSRGTPPPSSRGVAPTSTTYQKGMGGPPSSMQQPQGRASPLASTGPQQPSHPVQRPQQPVASPVGGATQGQLPSAAVRAGVPHPSSLAQPLTAITGQLSSGPPVPQGARAPAASQGQGVPPSNVSQPRVSQSTTQPQSRTQGFSPTGSAFSPVHNTSPQPPSPMAPPSPASLLGRSTPPTTTPPQSLPGLQPPSSQPTSERSTPSPHSMSALHSGKPKRPTMPTAQPGGYPGQAAGYPGQPAGYSSQQGGYPGQQGGYPGQPGMAPGMQTPPHSGASTPSGTPTSSKDGMSPPTSYPSPGQETSPPASRPSYMTRRRQYPTQQMPAMPVPGGITNMAGPAGQGFPGQPHPAMPGQAPGIAPLMPGQNQMPGQMPPSMQGPVPGGQMQPGTGQIPGQMQRPQMQGMAPQSPQGYGASPIDGPMGRLTVQQPSGVQPVSLLDQRHIVPTTPIEHPVPPLNPEMQKRNSAPSVLCCTLNAVPETKSLLTKSRLPLGLHLYPFKDLQIEEIDLSDVIGTRDGKSLPVIHSSVITRCRSCRTYINPFVTFTDSRRWRCPMCFRTNEVPEEFCYDPASKSYGDPSRRPEIKSATVEFIAPSEYMLRPPQPTVFLFVFDVSFNAIETGYLHVACKLLKENIDKMPGDSRTLVGFISFDSTVHFYSLKSKLTQPQMYIVSDLDDIFLPAPDDLLVNLKESKELVFQLLDTLPTMFSGTANIHSATGAALQAALKLSGPTGARVTLFQTTLPNIAPGELKRREEPNQKSSPKDVVNLAPATDFYKKFALDCAAEQVAVDMFLLSGQYADIATLMCASKYSGGSVYYYPDFHAARNAAAVEKFENEFTRYLTRKIGFEAVMRVRCTRGLAIHTFHGNFFVRSTDLVSLPNVNPDTSFCMQIDIEDSLTESNLVCFQSALLYTSSKGERRIRVHTLAMPTTTKLQDVYAHADQQAIAALLSKMAVDRTLSSSLGDAREALMNACIDQLTVYRQSVANQPQSKQVIAPYSLRLLPLYTLALLKHVSFRLGTTTRLDERCYAMQQLKTMPLPLAMLTIYPKLYPLHDISDEGALHTKAGVIPQPPCYHLSAEKLSRQGVFLMDTGHAFYIWVGRETPAEIIQQMFNVPNYSGIAENMGCLPELDNLLSTRVRSFVDYLQSQRTCHAVLYVLREDSRYRSLFLSNLMDDRSESVMSYYEFLMHLQKQISK